MNISYNPTTPEYAPTDTPPMSQEAEWIEAPKEFRSIGTQYVKPPAPKKKHTRQWKMTNLYNLAIKKYWKESGKNKKAKKKLRKILIDIFEDKKLAWSHLKETGLAKTIIELKKIDGKKDKDILKWTKGVMSSWKKKFNMRQIIVKK
jgi:hypothetical protein